jgi:hypothetical protein
MGQSDRMLPLDEQVRAILEAEGDNAGVGTACLNMAACCGSMAWNPASNGPTETVRALVKE